MTTVLLHGYYGRCNTGDDAFLTISAWAARTCFSARRLYATCHTLSETHGVPVRRMYYEWQRRGVTRLNRLRERFIARRADLVIFGGGSTLHTVSDLERNLGMLDRAGPGLHFAAGIGVGPFADGAAEAACARLLGRLAFVGARDQMSYQRARQLAPDSRVELTFDLAPLLMRAVGAPDPTGVAPPTAPPRRRTLAVALANLARDRGAEAEAARIARVARAIRACAERALFEEILLVDFLADREAPPAAVDRSSHEALAHALAGVAPLRHVAYARNPLVAYQALAEARAVLAMRLHAAVFAYCLGVPALIASYHEKCDEWAHTVGIAPELLIDCEAVDEELLATGLARALSDDPPAPTLPVAEAVARAARNWDWPGRSRPD
jgi:polysaccharide pyruvyl transferase WcaK-like protein